VSNETKAGTIFIREGTPMPAALRIESEPYMSGWRFIPDLDGNGLGRKLQGAGWTFFSLAGHVQAAALGRETQSVVRRAVRRMLTHLKSEKSNSFEITAVVSKRFLGVPYVTVSAHLRHIQDGTFLFRDKQAKDVREWDRTNLAAA